MTLTRRSIFAALGVPFLTRKVRAITHHPADVKIPAGLWLHFEETADQGPWKKNAAVWDYFESLGKFIRAKTGVKWLVHYSRQHINNAMEGGAMRAFRQKAIEGDSIATMIISLPTRTKYNTSVGLPTAYYFLADVITYKPIDGPVKFIKCRWQDQDSAAAEFQAYIA